MADRGAYYDQVQRGCSGRADEVEDKNRPRTYNPVLRGGMGEGMDMLRLMQDDLDEATVKMQEMGKDDPRYERARGRVTGLAQALAFVRSPITREDKMGKNSTAWVEVIRGEMTESACRVESTPADPAEAGPRSKG